MLSAFIRIHDTATEELVAVNKLDPTVVAPKLILEVEAETTSLKLFAATN